MTRIYYTYGGGNIKFQNWWSNFVDNIDMNCVETDEETLGFKLKRYRCIRRELEKIGGSWLPGTYYVDFDDEECYTLFLLRWS
jgi:hypothetical protein